MCLLKVLNSQQVFTELLGAAGDHSELGMFALRGGNEAAEEKSHLGTVPPPGRRHRLYGVEAAAIRLARRLLMLDMFMGSSGQGMLLRQIYYTFTFCRIVT